MGPDRTSPAEAERRSAIRARIQRFARIRSGHRVLPMTAGDREIADACNRMSEEVRTALQAFARDETEHAVDATELAGIDAKLAGMEADLLARIDRVSFAELRAALPRAMGHRPADVTALLDALLADPEGLSPRLSKLEYLVTVLATEEIDGERKVVHDPVRLTPALESIATAQAPSEEAEAVAIELFQAACPEPGHDDFETLRFCRDRKAALGLQRLSPNVLRAVVTYNARVFNRLASTLASGEEADALLEELVRPPDDADPAFELRRMDGLDDADEIWSRIGRDDSLEPEPAAVESLYENARMQDVLAALRRRLSDIPIGSCTSERVALALDVSRLDAPEREAIRSPSRSHEEVILAHAALLGLMLRDLGAVQSDLEELGIDQTVLGSSWLVELERDFARLVNQKLSDPEQYARASTLSGIKTKHLLAPLSSRRERRAVFAEEAEDAAAVDPSEASGEDSAAVWRARARRGRGGPTRGSALETERSGLGGTWSAFLASRQTRALAGASLMLASVLLMANFVTQRPTTVETLRGPTLSRTSPFLVSAYRNDEGRGRILIGRLDEDYDALAPERRLAVARDLVERLATDGVGEIMLYGPKSRLLVHSIDGQLRRPTR